MCVYIFRLDLTPRRTMRARSLDSCASSGNYIPDWSQRRLEQYCIMIGCEPCRRRVTLNGSQSVVTP